jgi:hypothetical protein
MPKTFWVEDGHDVLVGRIWYGAKILVLVEPGQIAEVYYAPNGKRGACIGSYIYESLDEERPPPGLGARDRGGWP